MKPFVSILSDSETSMVGYSITMLCHILSFDRQSSLELRWYKDNQVIPKEPLEIIFLERVSMEDAGRYSCSVSNGFVAKKSDAVELKVGCKFIFLKVK